MVRGRGRENSVRKRGRGRGRGFGRGGRHVNRSTPDRALTKSKDPTARWKVTKKGCNRVTLQDILVHDLVSEKARLLCCSAMSRLDVELTVRQLPASRSGIMTLFTMDVIQNCLTWLNERVILANIWSTKITLPEIYRAFAVLMLSHCTGLSLSKCIELLQRLGCSTPDLSLVRAISNNILAHSATGRGNDGQPRWSARRDMTPLLSEFEKTAFNVSAKVFFHPTYLTATLDDDLYGTRAADNQVKIISNRKADREGHAADVLADALFRITLAVRFRRRGEKQESNVEKLLQSLLDGRGEQSLMGFIITADRGYGKYSLLKAISRQGIGSIFIMPDNKICSHPFVGASFMDIHRDEVSESESENDSSNSETESTEVPGEPSSARDIGNSSGIDNVVTTQTSERHVDPLSSVQHSQDQPVPASRCEAETTSSPTPTNDRPKLFVIDDSSNAGADVRFARKKVKTSLVRSFTSHVTAVAVRERGDDKFSKVIRFLFSVPSSVEAAVDTWVAVPHETSSAALLFGKKTTDGKIITPSQSAPNMKGKVEFTVWSRCSVLTIGQRCADWFVLRQFRITGTNAGVVLSRSTVIRERLGLGQVSGDNPEQTQCEQLTKLVSGWFSTMRSTEAMKRGSANESAVLNALAQKAYIEGLFECGMLGVKGLDWLACSPDGVAVINLGATPFRTSQSTSTSANMQPLATIEIKTGVADSTLDSSVMLASASDIFCDITDNTCRTMVCEEHMFQVLQQMVVLSTNYGIYVAACETGILRTVVIRCPTEVLNLSRELLRRQGTSLVAWAHTTESVIPLFADRTSKQNIKGHLAFWKVIDTYVKGHGPFPPLRLFKHGSQSLYSKTKGGVDGSTQARAVLRSSTSSFRWEQKIVTQTLKTLWVNGFIAWRMHKKKDKLESQTSFSDIDAYRHSLNTVQSLADFSFDCTTEFLVFADELEKQMSADNTVERREDRVIEETELRRLHNLAKNRKRNRLVFFNGNDGRNLRLSGQLHVHKQYRPPRFCAVCGTCENEEGYRGHRSTYRCELCCVHLCMKVWPGYRKSCWSVWHGSRAVQPRSMQNTRLVHSRYSADEDAGNEEEESEVERIVDREDNHQRRVRRST